MLTKLIWIIESSKIMTLLKIRLRFTGQRKFWFFKYQITKIRTLSVAYNFVIASSSNSKQKYYGVSSHWWLHYTQCSFILCIWWSPVKLLYFRLYSVNIDLALTKFTDSSNNKYSINFLAILFSTATVFGNLGGAHRLWSHKSYKATWQLRTILMLLQTAGYQNTIHKWVREHRSVNKCLEYLTNKLTFDYDFKSSS